MWDSYFKQHFVTVVLLLLILTSAVMVDSKYKGIDTEISGGLKPQPCRRQCGGKSIMCTRGSQTFMQYARCLSEKQRCYRICDMRYDSRTFHLGKQNGNMVELYDLNFSYV